MKLVDIVPKGIMSLIRDRYLAGVADAEAQFELSRADEDSLTGALGQSISSGAAWTYSSGQQSFEVQISYRKIRGRGKGAPEKIYGTDGLFQIIVYDETDAMVFVKGLPFQAKTEWKGVDRRLSDQAGRMVRSTHTGLIVNYKKDKFDACAAKTAVEAEGSIELAEKAGSVKSLGQLLGNDFLDCKIGAEGLFFDPETEKFLTVKFPPLPISHLITTVVRENS